MFLVDGLGGLVWMGVEWCGVDGGDYELGLWMGMMGGGWIGGFSFFLDWSSCLSVYGLDWSGGLDGDAGGMGDVHKVAELGVSFLSFFRWRC